MELVEWVQMGIVMGLAYAFDGSLSGIHDELRGIEAQLRRANERERRLRRDPVNRPRAK